MEVSNQNNNAEGAHFEGHFEGQFNQSELLETANSAAELVREVVMRRPVAAIAVGFGVGYVLGGGLPKFATRLMGAVGLRILAEGMIRGGAGKLLAGLGDQSEDQLNQSGSTAGQSGGSSRPSTEYSAGL